MKKICLEKVSTDVYDYFFSKKFQKKEWKIGHIIKNLEEEMQEVFYMGAGFEDRYWMKKQRLNRTHFYLRFIMGKEHQGNIHSVSFYEKNAYVPEEELVQVLKTSLRIQGIDVLLHIKGYDRLNNLCATGQKSEYILQLLMELRKIELFHGYDVEGLSFSYWFCKNLYHVKIDINKKQLILLNGSYEMVTFHTIEDVKKWNRDIINEQKQIEEIWDRVTNLIQLKTKWKVEALKKESQIRINDHYVLSTKIEKQYRRGKKVFFISLHDEKIYVSNLDEIEEKIQEFALKFCHKHRIRKLTTQK